MYIKFNVYNLNVLQKNLNKSRINGIMLFQRAFQSTGFFPDAFKQIVSLEKCLHPKKPKCAEYGDGCEVSRTS